jgi:hypothetical protein
MNDLLASVSEEATLMARRDAAAAEGLDSAEARRLGGLIVDVVKREVEAEGAGDDVASQPASTWRSRWGRLNGARYIFSLAAILPLLYLSVGPETSAASTATSMDTARPVAAMSSSMDLLTAPALATARPTSALPPTCDSIPIPETPPKVGDIINGGYWARISGDAWTYQVTGVQRQRNLQWGMNRSGNTGYSTATGSWNIVRIRLMNAGKKSRVPYTEDFQIIDQDRREYTVDVGMSVLYNDYNQLSSFDTVVPPGVWIEMGLVSDVPPGADGLLLCIMQAGTMVDLGD